MKLTMCTTTVLDSRSYWCCLIHFHSHEAIKGKGKKSKVLSPPDFKHVFSHFSDLSFIILVQEYQDVKHRMNH